MEKEKEEQQEEQDIDRLEDEGGPVLDIPEFLQRKKR